MKRSEAISTWNKIFEAKDPRVRSQLLQRILSANPRDILALASSGRRRYDAGGDEYLFAKTRKENSLFDAIEISVSKQSGKKQLYRIGIYSEMNFRCVPRGMLRNTVAVASTTGPIAGKDSVRRNCLGPNHYVPELANAIPRLEFYQNYGLKTRCYWTAEDALQDFKDWLAQLHSADATTRKLALLAIGRFNASDFCDEAREAIADQARARLLAALADSDTQARRGAVDILRSLELSGDDVFAAVALNSDSDDPGIRETALDQAIWMTCDPDTIVETICRGLNDSAVSVRKWACTAIRGHRSRLSARNAKKLGDLIRKKIKVVDDVELLTTLVQCFPSASGIKELCHMIQNTTDAPLRALAILRLGKIGENDPEAIRTILENFDEFPLHASDALLEMRCYSSKAKAKMSQLLTANDWSQRWRGVLYLENCPRLSRAMGKSLEERLNDKEFTVRDAAQRVLQKLKQKEAL